MFSKVGFAGGKLYSLDKLKYSFRSDYKQFSNVLSAILAWNAAKYHTEGGEGTGYK